MTSYEIIHLQLRLRNCIQTILELEPTLKRTELGNIFLKEYGVLKACLERLNQISFIEDDVICIERATESFLNELRTPMSMMRIVHVWVPLMQ